VAYNQTRRHPFSPITLEDLRNSTIRVQDNNLDTILALAQRTFGAAYQFVPPMSVTLGIKECLSAQKVRLFSDTGAWKQTALRVALFGPLTVEYPITLLQEHPDALITATVATASHPISEHPEWDLGFGG
jgi:glucosamine-6-phosphate deaminase